MSFNYSQLRDIQKREMESSALVPLPDEFYKAISQLLSQKRIEAFQSNSLFAIKEYENMRKILLSIQSKREEKIVLMALRGESTASNLTGDELKMLQDIAATVSKSRSLIRSAWDEEERKSNGESSNPETKLDENSLLVRLTKDVASYKGVDNQVYGPFKEGEECTLPRKEAEWLVKSGMAEAL